MTKDIFAEGSLLVTHSVILDTKEYFTEEKLEDILEAQSGGEYYVLASCVHSISLGRLKDGKLSFANNEIPQEKYLQELRIFNRNREILIRKACVGYLVRVLDDSSNEGIEVEAVDTTSNFFGKNVDKSMPNYASLYEEGRKIKLMIPVSEQKDYYALETRSYIEYDKETAQAGYGKYRFLDVVVSEGVDK